jgi:hypothetical protein
MTVSAVTSYSLTLNELIEEAFDLIGVGSEGEAVSADMYARAKRSLNLMILSWNADEYLWRRETRSVTLIASTASYALASPKPMRVEAARRKNTASGFETPMTMWSRQEYLDQPNKTSSLSTPVNFYYDPQRDTGTLYLWPAPASNVASANTVELDILRPMFVMSSSADTLDFPQEWQEAVVYNLAVRLMAKYAVNDASQGQLVIAQAGNLLAQMKAWDQETASIYLQPENRWGQWR